MYSTAGVAAVSGTTSCASHTLSNSVRGAMRSLCPAGIQPGHARAQLSPDLLDRMAQIRLQELRVFAPSSLGLGDPLAGELALLDLAEDFLHFPLRRLVHDPRSAGEVAVLGGLGDEAVHLGESALVQQIDDELELVQTFVVRDRGLVAGLHQG